jgi:broad specificity phosphatase PhoE
VTALLVVRHGQSTWNADGRWQGQADPPLSPLGEAQAADAGRTLAGCDAIWASDLERASRTATIIAARAGGAAPLDVVLDARVRERDAGEWTGLTRAEIDARDPGALREGRRPPGFEPDESLAARALAALGEFGAALPDDGVGLVVTHGGLIRVVERELGGDPEAVPNLGGRRVLVQRSGLVLGERVLLLDPGGPGVAVTVPRQI